MQLKRLRLDLLPLLCAAALAASGLWSIMRGDAGGWWPACIFGACAAILYLAPRRREGREGAARVAEHGLVVDAVGVRRFLDDAQEQVRWDELREVWIVTTSQGPFVEDVFFVLHGAGGNGVVVPQGVAMEHKLLDTLQARLPGLDNEAIIRAMGCADDARFVIWTSPPAQE